MPTYLDDDLYLSIENYDHVNRWSSTQDYLSHGFLYPFLHSISDLKEEEPEGYSQSEAEALLALYEDVDIPEDKKINVIAIMREAYADFSQYGIQGLDDSAYDLYHSLESESLTGTLVTNIFAGGTIDSERCFLTGNYQLRNFRSDANSYLWYLRDQGYTVEGSHPYYQWFYNRLNVNGYLGFQSYRFLEGDYENLSDLSLPEDSVLYPEIYKDFVAGTADGTPYFSFSVNVQSHGPYSTTSYNSSVQYLTGDYSQECLNAMNNYVATSINGDYQLMGLVENLRQDENPVVLVVFGDHLPWMGDGNVFYEEMGVDIDPSTEEGFLRHYSTKYLIWANDAAKEIIGHDIAGDGPTISPCYLMNLTFSTIGWTGPAFMQAMDDYMETFPVVSIHGFYNADGTYYTTLPEEYQEKFSEFKYLQYYWLTEYLG
jgi:hypothetical protein